MDINMNSGQVEILSPYGKVYLYTHDTADTLVSTVHEALALRKRWDDADYLAKMIFCRMITPEHMTDDKGFGIGTQLYADTNLLITLDTMAQVITIQAANVLQDKYSMTFEDFVTSFWKNASI